MTMNRLKVYRTSFIHNAVTFFIWPSVMPTSAQRTV